MILRNFKHNLINKNFQTAVETSVKLSSNNSMLSFSQSCQDLFVVAMLEGRSNGTFLEIGCSQPKYSNNTFVLDKFFLFSGVSIDLQYDEHWNQNQHLDITERSWPLCRPGVAWHKADALLFDYSTLPNYFDYLQVDIDPPAANLAVLEKICSSKKFAVITFEHDDWNPVSRNENIKQRSRDFLLSKGYELIAGDVGSDDNAALMSYEDWWAHPDFINKEVIHSYKVTTPIVKHWEEVLFNSIK